MKKFAVAAALLTAIVATPALAAPGGEGRVEVRGGLITGNGQDEATLGAAAGYDFDLGSSTFLGAEIAGDKVLVDGAKVQFSAGGRAGAKIGANGKLYATGGYTFGDVDDPYVGAGYQHKLGQNLYAKGEYRHQFINNFGDFDTFVVGVGFAF
ncbi:MULTISPECIES: outer membrane protein [unclassified Sphingopyxis]|jgi:outer membrane protein W|uniref:outer membrane protein n=1 Tax=unclassified Sphingopyxis TaxID=2614943 RepID=UPI0006C4A537|nr:MULTISPECIES: outer membrane beta-barrel protein [unclassified Sphingopyxis]USI78116.1 porin family protein [Sphingopyxis sp. USTB-05]GAO79501.1 outer membrane protein, putative [Sphingopyxis sp. C-1]